MILKMPQHYNGIFNSPSVAIVGSPYCSAILECLSSHTSEKEPVTLPEILEDERGPIPRVGPMVPDDKMLEEDEGIDMFDDDGWTKERLKFVNVPVIDTRKLHY